MTARDSSQSGPDHRIAALVLGRRRVVLLVVAAVVLATSSGVVMLEEETGFGEASVGTAEEATLEYVEANFSTPGTDREVAQVLVESENVFAKETLIETLELQQRIRTDDVVAPTLAADRQTAGIANVLATAAYRQLHDTGEDLTLAEQIETLESFEQSQIDRLVRTVLDEEDGVSDAFVFLPESYEPGTTKAPSTMIVVFQTVDEEYPPAAAPDQVVDSHQRVQSLGEQSALTTTTVGSGLLTSEDERAIDETLTLLGPAALLLVLAVLALAYRDLIDIVLGLVGIVLVQLWTFGTLGWLGIPFNPVLIAVPILLIGLSIDYCIHVFMRYREQLEDQSRRGADAAGADEQFPDGATAMAAGLAGVGVALIWVTVTTSIGFLSNLVSPLAPIHELGLVAAIGIVGSFVVFVLLLPPLKVEIDGLLSRRGFDRRKAPLGTGGGRVGRVLAAGAAGARRAPLVILVAICCSLPVRLRPPPTSEPRGGQQTTWSRTGPAGPTTSPRTSGPESTAL